MTFSKGKTWNLEDLRVVEMINVSSIAHLGSLACVLTVYCSLNLSP